MPVRTGASLALACTVILIASSVQCQEPAAVKKPAFLLPVRVPKLKPPEPGQAPATKLAPELQAVKQLGGRLYGRSRSENVALLGFDNQGQMNRAIEALGQLKDFARTEKDVVPDEIDVFSEYLITYSVVDPEKPAERMLDAAARGIGKRELEPIGLQLIRDDKFAKYVLVRAPGGLTRDAVLALEKHAGVIFVEPNRPVRLPLPARGEPAAPPELKAPAAPDDPAAIKLGARPHSSLSALALIPNDPLFGALWGMANINAPEAWDSLTNSTRIVAVVDTGIDAAHRDLTGSLWTNTVEQAGTAGADDDGNGFIDDIHGFDFARNDGDPDDEPLATAPQPLGHGTHVAGTIAATGNDNFGVTGVVWRGQIMALKFMTPHHETLSDGTVIATSSGDIADSIRGIDYACTHGASIINASYGQDTFMMSERNAIAAAMSRGVIFVAAAGNGGADGVGDDNDATPHYPSSHGLANIVAVAATTWTDTLTGFSNFGLSSVDIGAPGTSILSTVPAWNPGAPHTWAGGTSMAAPHVSGAAALIWAHPDHAGRSWREIIGLILANNRQAASLAGRCVTGGILDLDFLAPPIPEAGEAYTTFGPSTFRGATNLGQIVFRLEEPMFVHITAHASAKLLYPSLGKDVRVGLSFSPTSGGAHPDSLRSCHFARRGAVEDLTSSLGRKLEPGTHRVFFQVIPGNGRGIAVESMKGSIMVEAFGRTLGGDL